MKMTRREIEINSKMLAESRYKVDQRIAQYIISVVGRFYNVSENYYLVKNRKREIVFARQVSMYLILRYTKLTLEHVGSFFSGKDHATVLHGKRTVNDLIESDRNVEIEIQKLNNIINLKSKALIEEVNLDDDFYYIDFNNHTSIKLKENKGMILTGFTNEEIELLTKELEVISKQEHQNTGLYILEELIKERL